LYIDPLFYIFEKRTKNISISILVSVLLFVDNGLFISKEMCKDWFEIRSDQKKQKIYQNWLKDWLQFIKELCYHFELSDPIRDTTIAETEKESRKEMSGEERKEKEKIAERKKDKSKESSRRMGDLGQGGKSSEVRGGGKEASIKEVL